MILCVTPNPAIDRTLVVPTFEIGGVFRTEQVITAAGGKGMNVARVALALGASVRCSAFVAGVSGQLFAALAGQDGLPGDWTWIEGETRTCVILADRSRQDVAVVNESGPRVAAADWERFTSNVLTSAADAAAVCLCGSVPPGSQPQHYAQLLQALLANGHAVWVDTSGASLGAALDVPGVNVKVNHEEAGALVGRAVHDAASALSVAADIRRRTGGAVVVTMGKAGAVMLVDAGGFSVPAPVVQAVSNVGSGDAFLAGLLTGLAESPQRALAQAVAVGAANTLMYGGGRFAPADYQRLLAAIHVEPAAAS